MIKPPGFSLLGSERLRRGRDANFFALRALGKQESRGLAAGLAAKDRGAAPGEWMPEKWELNAQFPAKRAFLGLGRWARRAAAMRPCIPFSSGASGRLQADKLQPDACKYRVMAKSRRLVLCGSLAKIGGNIVRSVVRVPVENVQPSAQNTCFCVHEPQSVAKMGRLWRCARSHPPGDAGTQV